LQGASGQQIDSYSDTVYQQQFGHVPAELKITPETTIKYFSIPLSNIRCITVLLPVVPTALLIITLLLIIGVILADREFKNVFWNLGITLVISTFVGHFYVLLAREAGIRITASSILPSFNLWIIQVATDVLAFINGPFMITLAIGGGMLIVSLLFILLHKARNKGMHNTAAYQKAAP